VTADAAAGGLGAVHAAVAETHSAVVFFVGDRAYKLKKPVDLGFLDFTEPRARAAACRREITLNRRFAPDVYLGVAALHGPDGRVCDHLVVMRRMPAARRLSALVRAGADVERPVRQVARVLAAWHAAAPRSRRIAAQGTPEALWRRWEASVGQVRGYPVSVPAAAAVHEVEQRARRFIAGRAALFEERIRGGYLVDGHGDLLAEDIFCPACAGSTGWMTPRSWRWTWNVSAPRAWRGNSPGGTRSSPLTRPRPPLSTTTRRTGRSSAPRSLSCAPRRLTSLAGRRRSN
jgi:uncharacterized protein